MELSSAVNYIFHDRFTPLTEKIQYVAAFLLQIQSSASQQISFLSAAMLLWHSSGLLPSFSTLPFMSRSMCKYLKTLNSIIATWMHAQKNPKKPQTKQHRTKSISKLLQLHSVPNANLQNQGAGLPFPKLPDPQTIEISFSSKPQWEPTFLCLFATSPLRQNMQRQLQLELVMLGRGVWVKNMTKNKWTGEIILCCVFHYA